jgi:hypothetical protein
VSRLQVELFKNFSDVLLNSVLAARSRTLLDIQQTGRNDYFLEQSYSKSISVFVF